MLPYSTITDLQLCMYLGMFHCLYLAATKWYYCRNKTVCLIVCYAIIVRRCYYRGFVRADRYILVLSPFCKLILLCVSVIPLPRAFVVMQPPPKVMDECLLVIWARLIKTCFLSGEANRKKHLFSTGVSLHNASEFCFLLCCKNVKYFLYYLRKPYTVHSYPCSSSEVTNS